MWPVCVVAVGDVLGMSGVNFFFVSTRFKLAVPLEMRGPIASL